MPLSLNPHFALKQLRTTLAALTLIFALHSTAAETRGFSSNGESVQLIELYTSQGCSSCPPAEKKLNSLLDHPDLWSKIIPIAFHVDYWDRLGWKDPFANPANTKRQYAQSDEGNVKSVYTPCFIINGKEWRGYFSGNSWPQSSKSVGILKTSLNNSHLKIEYSESNDDLQLNVAILGVGITTAVKSGENRNKKLEQEFVALWHQSITKNWNIALPKLESLVTADRYALAVWVTKKNSLKPIQATGGWL